MFDKLDEIKNKYAELTKLISQPDVIADQNKWTKLVKEHSSLTEIVETYDSLLAMNKDLSEAEDLLKLGADEEMTLLLEDEVKRLRHLIPETEEKLKILLLPKDPDDDNNVIIEIRAGAGGDEAALFAAEAQRMYYRYAERQRWKTEEIDINESELGGVKEVTFSVIGKGAYSRLKYESGVHRVQRVPATESQGRIHTSTITVAVLPEVDDVQVVIEEKDHFKKQTLRLLSFPGRKRVLSNKKNADWHGGQKRKNKNLQLPAGQGYRSPYIAYSVLPRRVSRRRPRPDD